MLMKNALLSLLSKALNAYFALDPSSSFRLQKLYNKTINLQLLPFPFIFQCLFTQKGVEISMPEKKADASIRGTPLALMQALFRKEKRAQFFAEDLTLEGDALVAQAVITLLDEIEIDWGSFLTYLMGEVPSYYSLRLLKVFRSFMSNTHLSFYNDLSDYLHEEIQYFPPKERIEDFLEAVDKVRLDVDRLEARINRLKVPKI